MDSPTGGFVVIELLVLLLLNVLIQLWLALEPVLRLLGFLRSLGEPSTPSPAIAPPSPSSIKIRLPVVKYVNLMTGEERTCTICLEELEERDEVRELGNCSHVLHKGCIDRWIDMGQASCPSCRSQLLPEEGKKGRRLLKLLL